jgi:Peptidogalycan biosysnthesis/recognition
MAGGYFYRVTPSIAQVDPTAWDDLCANTGAGVMHTRRYLQVVEDERLFDGEQRYITLSTPGSSQLLAAAICTILPIDLVSLADEPVRRAVGAIRKLVPSFLRVKAALCGIPVGLGQSSVLIRDGADVGRLLRALDRLLQSVAQWTRAAMVLYQDFGPQDELRLKRLEERSYLRVRSLPSYTFPIQYHTFDEYLHSLRAVYRSSIRRSQRKLRNVGVTLERVSDASRLTELYGDQAHQLYLAVEAKAEYQFELVTKHFFYALAQAFPGELTCVFGRAPSGEIIGFLWSLIVDKRYYGLYIGLDYRWSERSDLYFNLIYADMEYALRQGLNRIDIGPTADSFKARLGGDKEPRYLAVQARHALLAGFLRWTLPWLTSPVEQIQAFRVFRDQVTKTISPDPPSPDM